MRGYAAIGLYQPKTPINVGSVLRAAHVFDAACVIIHGRRFEKSCTDTQKAWRHIPIIHEVPDLLQACPFGAVPVAVELCEDAQPLETYTHPNRAFYIFGPEDGSISKEVLLRCPHKVKISSRFCLNLAATVNVVLYDRQLKQMMENKNV